MAQEFEFDDEEVQKFLEQIAKNIKNPTAVRAVIDSFSAIVFADVIQHFRDEKGPTGSWKKWSKMYAEHMRKIGRGGNKKLQFTGRMRDNFRPESHTINPSSINWWNNAKTKSGYPYAWGHDSGDGKLPQREFMWLSPKAQEKMVDVVWKIMLEEND